MGLRNKVLEGLECCARRKDTDVDYCDKCPYFSGCSTEFGAFAELASDALALLKAQEPVKPIENAGFYYCGACKYAFTVNRQKYCSECGRKVKWE